MAKQKKAQAAQRKVPKVRIARPAGRPFQLRYDCPIEGRQIRISTGTRNEQNAKRQKAELEAELLLYLKRSRVTKRIVGPKMPWDEFREQYRLLHLDSGRDRSADSAESRLNIAERIIKPRVLVDMANAEALHHLQAALLKGAESRFDRERSKHTVKSYMTSILTALNWAHVMGWIDAVPKIKKVKVSKLKAMKGRPISLEEFERMLGKTSIVVGQSASASWQHVLFGLWTSALRIDELMHVSWDLPETITPVWKRGRLPVLSIPASMQKNDTEEDIPLLPWFEELLKKTPMDDRTGWVFNPASLQDKYGRRASDTRPEAEWVGKIISRIGEAAGVIVTPSKASAKRKAKFASAHDLRRSCADRLQDAGVPELLICRILRHASWETTRRHYAAGNVQREAGMLRELLSNDDSPIDRQTRPHRRVESVPGYINGSC